MSPLKNLKTRLSFIRPDHLFQAGLIFLSVFLGTIAADWNENRKEEARTTDFLVRLSEELSDNQKRIDSSMVYHSRFSKLSDSLFHLLAEKKIPSRFIEYGGTSKIPGWRGTGFAGLDHSIYQSGYLSGVVSNLPLDLLTQLSRLQKAQESYKKFTEELFQRIVNVKMDTETSEWVILLNFMGGDLLALEKRISGLNQDVLSRIRTELERR